MVETRIDFKGFHWLDLSNPKADRLKDLAARYKLHPTSVADCLEPEHLPKFELIDEVAFMILRAYDVECAADADSVQDLTRKVAIFYAKDFIITVHRKDQPFLDSIRAKWQDSSSQDVSLSELLAEVINGVVRSYEKPVYESVDHLELLEMEVFGAGTSRKFKMSKGYYLKRKAAVFKRMLRATLEPLNKVMASAPPVVMPHLQNSREMIDGLVYDCDEVIESVASILNLYVSMASQKTNEASHKTNEVMRVLTIFSCFFLPINFVASIYGMNFANLPETQWTYGYYYALGLMAAVVLVIYIWFWRKGWLKS